jgi:hypothetical protein
MPYNVSEEEVKKLKEWSEKAREALSASIGDGDAYDWGPQEVSDLINSYPKG